MKLVIAEKPSVAMSIANVIGATEKQDGFSQGNGYIVSWCVGHLITSADPDQYDSSLKNWSLSSLPILPIDYKLSVISTTKNQFSILKSLINRSDVDSIICATDAGREGELIFRLVYNYCNCTKPFQRLWISSMENKAIKDGFNNLLPGEQYNNLYKAAYTRMRADWYVGINLSRLYSLIYNQKLSIGRVQTPVINLLVQRQKEIESFKSTPYYILSADCGDFIAYSEKFEDKTEALNAKSSCDNQQGQITLFETKQKKENPPTLFDLTSLQRQANKLYGYTAQQVLDIVQSLYEKKLLTYPRTDSKYITEDMIGSTTRLIEGLLQSSLVDESAKSHFNFEHIKMEHIVNDKKVSDHHAIIPTMTLLNKDTSDLSNTELNCLKLVIYRLLAAVSMPYIYDETSVILKVNNIEFKAKGKTVIEYGYKHLSIDNLKNNSSDEPITLPNTIELNKIYNNVAVDILSKKTTPPQPYNDDTLLSAMENAGKHIDDKELKEALNQCEGLGTPATRAGIIEKIINSGYAERKKKVISPTQKAIALIKIVPDDVKSPELTAKWEMKLSDISNGTLSDEDFIKELFSFISTLCDDKTESSDNVDKDIFKIKPTVIGVCPRCGKEIIEYQKSFSCESGKDGCGFVIWKNDRFWSEKKKTLTPAIVKKLLSDGKVKVKGLYSAKKDKKYDATVVMVDSGKYINFKLLF